MSSTLTAVAVTGLLAFAFAAAAEDDKQWGIHDLNRPQPRVVDPGGPGRAPSDAVVLFDGKDLSKWKSAKTGAAAWKVENGYFEVVKGTGGIETVEPYGDGQLHIEWMAPSPAVGEGQDRGNSGVFFGPYEVQVLDSYNSKTYPDGQAGALYGQYPPLVNASRPPGEWQTYDIAFRRPRFRPDGGLLSPARITVIHNGILVQDGVEPWGPTAWLQALPYTSHADRLPLGFQDHGNPVRYRNIWLRELPEGPGAPPLPDARPVVNLPVALLDRYVGKYQVTGEGPTVYTITRRGGQLFADFYWNGQPLELVPHSDRVFSLRWTAGEVEFDVKPDGTASGLRFRLGGDTHAATRAE
jgi:hypothetical protein